MLSPTPILASLCYLAAAALAWAGASRGRPALAAVASGGALVALILQGIALAPALGAAEDGVVLTLTDAAALVGAVIGAVALVGALRGRLSGAAAALWLAAGVLALGSGSRGVFEGQVSHSNELIAHIVLSALAAGLLSVAAVLVLLLAAQDSKLRARQPLGWLAALPPMEALERAVFSMVLAGFVALSLALLSGFLFVDNLFSQHLIHKTALSIVAWCIFGTLLVGRHRFGWRGRQALRFLLTGYVILALAYFGTKFVLEVVLDRHWG